MQNSSANPNEASEIDSLKDIFALLDTSGAPDKYTEIVKKILSYLEDRFHAFRANGFVTNKFNPTTASMKEEEVMEQINNNSFQHDVKSEKSHSDFIQRILSICTSYQNSDRRSLLFNGIEYNKSSDNSSDIIRSVEERLVDNNSKLSLEEALHLLNASPSDQSEAIEKCQKEMTQILSSLQTSKTEDAVQGKLLEFIKKDPEISLIDCSKSARNCPFLSFPDMATNEEDRSYTFSSRPDFASLRYPLFGEIKIAPSAIDDFDLSENEYGVLDQGLDRLFCQSRLNELVHRIISIVTCGGRCWLLLLTRKYLDPVESCTMVIRDDYSIHQISIADVYSVIMAMNRQALQDPIRAFVHRDMVTLSKTLTSLNIHPGFSMMKLIRHQDQGTRLYEITPYELSPSGCSLRISCGTLTNPQSKFMIKINDKSDKDGHSSSSCEIASLKKIFNTMRKEAKKKNQKARRHSPVEYVIGVMQNEQYLDFSDNLLSRSESFQCSLLTHSRGLFGPAEDLFYQKSAKPTRHSSRLPQQSYEDSSVNRFMIHLSYSSWSSSLQSYLQIWFNWAILRGCTNSTKDCIVMKCGVFRNFTKDSFSKTTEIVKYLSADIETLHRCGVAHTDIRPANLIFVDGRCYLIDFDHSFLFDGSHCRVPSSFVHPGDRMKYLQEVLGATFEFTKNEYFEWDVEKEKAMLNIAVDTLYKMEEKPQKQQSVPVAAHYIEFSRQISDLTSIVKEWKFGREHSTSDGSMPAEVEEQDDPGFQSIDSGTPSTATTTSTNSIIPFGPVFPTGSYINSMNTTVIGYPNTSLGFTASPPGLVTYDPTLRSTLPTTPSLPLLLAKQIEVSETKITPTTVGSPVTESSNRKDLNLVDLIALIRKELGLSETNVSKVIEMAIENLDQDGQAEVLKRKALKDKAAKIVELFGFHN